MKTLLNVHHNPLVNGTVSSVINNSSSQLCVNLNSTNTNSNLIHTSSSASCLSEIKFGNPLENYGQSKLNNSNSSHILSNLNQSERKLDESSKKIDNLVSKSKTNDELNEKNENNQTTINHSVIKPFKKFDFNLETLTSNLIDYSNYSKSRGLSKSDNLFKSKRRSTDHHIRGRIGNLKLGVSHQTNLNSSWLGVINNTQEINNNNNNESNNNDNKNSITKETSNNKSPWDIICKIINCKYAFKKQYNGKKYNWIQLAGHPGRFKPGERDGYILKLMDKLERDCLIILQNDLLKDFVPRIDQVFMDQEDKKYYLEMQDLLYSFMNPSIMDIKIGTRTFLEDDADEKETKPRNDLYLKLIEMAPNEPTEKEHELKAITKRRYMSWRESSTCSSTLGFRIEAIKKCQVSEKEFYTVKEKKEVQSHFKNFTDNKKKILGMYLNRLNELREALENSDFFKNHEMIGSSLLFVHDDSKANIWMIDFGKTRLLPSHIKINHRNKWIDGNHEDGYLVGIENLIGIFEEAYTNA